MKVKFFLILVLSVVSFGLSAQETGAIAGLLSDKEFVMSHLFLPMYLLKAHPKEQLQTLMANTLWTN